MGNPVQDALLGIAAPVFFDSDIPDDWEDRATPKSVSVTSKAGHMQFTMNQFTNDDGKRVLAELRVMVLMLENVADTMQENLEAEGGGLS